MDSSQSPETLTVPPQVQDSNPKEDVFAAITKNSNTGAADTAFAGNESGVMQTAAPVNPEAEAEKKMMELRQRIARAQAQAQAQAGGENKSGATHYEQPTDMNVTKPEAGVSDKENLKRTKAYKEEVRNQFLAEQNVPKKQSLFASIISAPARAIKKVRDTISSAINGVKTRANAFTDKISSFLKPVPRQTTS